ADRATWLKLWQELTEITAAPPAPARPTANARRACVPGLAAGTPVWSLAGLRPIEELRAGDMVLTQDVATGALGFGPVLTIRPGFSAPVKTIGLDGAAITSTGLERLWLVGKGWEMAGDLQPGDALRALGGVVRVAHVDVAEARPVHHVQVPPGRGI